jgi:hypothetical protein
MIGWIKIHRKITEHWIWSRPEYFQWWIDILIHSNFETKELLIKNKVLKCDRGEVLYSLDTWAKRWKTNKSKVKRFLEMLKKSEMIRYENETVTTRITICNYDSYQGLRNDSETEVKQERNGSETEVKPTKEGKEGKELIIPEKEKINDAVFVSISNNTRWIEALCIRYKTDPNLVIEHLREFYFHCIIIDEWKTTDSKAMAHFNNWINKGNPIPTRKVTSLSDNPPESY